jgi:hypothetical protein
MEVVMRKERTVREARTAYPTLEGAGVKLHRVFGFGDEKETDPFLLLDDFRSERPEEYKAGFPWHPHRGIETITYVLAGEVDHGDSLGNAGTIGPGDVQWMTAGSGIIHQEMPRGEGDGRMYGFQLWANLPAAEKMGAPKYRGITSGEIPAVEGADGSVVRVICGSFEGTVGPVDDVAIAPEYFDVSLPAGGEFQRDVPSGKTLLVYVIEGEIEAKAAEGGNRSLLLFGDGEETRITAGGEGARFLFITGTPLEEPIAWRGPIVMNSEEELQRAFEEFRAGTFVKEGARE